MLKQPEMGRHLIYVDGKVSIDVMYVPRPRGQNNIWKSILQACTKFC